MSAVAPEPPLYPLFLKVAGRRCVVIGGGPIGAQKARELLVCGALVLAVSPTFDDAWDALANEFPGLLTQERATWSSRHAAGAFVLFSATADPVVDAQVWDEGHRVGALVNIVDVPHRCDFYAGAVVRRGPVQVLIGTGGASPSLAIALKHRIEGAVLPAHGLLGEALGTWRDRVRTRFPEYRARARRLNCAVACMSAQLDDEDAATVAARVDAWMEIVLACPHPCGDASTCCVTKPLPAAIGERA